MKYPHLNIKTVIILLFAVLFGACRRETADAEKTMPADSLEQVRPLALRMDIFNTMENIAV